MLATGAWSDGTPAAGLLRSRPGTQKRWRRLFQELAGLRRGPFEAACRQAGISQGQVWLVQLRRGELLLMSLHAPQLRRALRELANSPCPVDHWLHSQLQALLGWSPQEMLPEEQFLLPFIWPGENPGC